MYYVKTRATRELARQAFSDKARDGGRTGHRSRGAVVGVGSLVTAQRVARLLRGNGLLR